MIAPIDLNTLIKMRFHVSVGGLFVPAAELIALATKYCHPLLLDNQNEDLPVSVAGSSVLIKYRGQLLQLACRHQLENLGRDPSEARIVNLGPPRVLVPPRYATRLEPDGAAMQNMRDVIAFEYVQQPDAHFTGKFLPLDMGQFAAVPPQDADNVIFYFSIGFPSQRIGYELSPDGDALENLRARFIRIELQPDASALRLVPNRTYMRAAQPFISTGLDCDGLSGSPVFCVYQSADRQCHLGFCGIITDANNHGVVAIYDGPGIQAFLDSGRQQRAP